MNKVRPFPWGSKPTECGIIGPFSVLVALVRICEIPTIEAGKYDVAVEPVGDGEIEFSEISPSSTDGKTGKLIWASGSEEPGRFRPAAITRKNIILVSSFIFGITRKSPDEMNVELPGSQ